MPHLRQQRRWWRLLLFLGVSWHCLGDSEGGQAWNVTNEDYDCQVDPVEHWSETKKQWCCSNKQLGCTKHDVALEDSPVESEPFDCRVDPVEHWSEEKKQWCCSQKQLGCAAVDSKEVSEPFDCKVDPVEHWSDTKKQWCCTNKQLGCTAEGVLHGDSPAESEPFDCKVDPVEHWSEEKQQWCCSNKQLGCAKPDVALEDSPVESEPFDCRVDPVEHWSEEKKQWCCSQKQLGCAAVDSKEVPEPFDCKVDPVEHWSEEKQQWCCSNKQLGCAKPDVALEDSPVQSEPFDCRAVPVEHWSEAEKEWCCSQKQLGCAAVDSKEVSEPFDCKVDPVEHWSDAKKQWCCSNKQLGCTAEGVLHGDSPVESEPFDCTADPVEHWSEAKQQWCCANKESGCLEVDPVKSSEPFDCHSEEVWSPTKREWCCEEKRIGCPTFSPMEYDCLSGLPTWKQNWTAMHALYCCVFKGVACADEKDETPLQKMKEAVQEAQHREQEEEEEEEAEAEDELEQEPAEPEEEFDCSEGLANWQRGFSEAKKEFCCQRHHVACPSTKFTCTSGSPEFWSVKRTIWCCQHFRIDHPACAAVPEDPGEAEEEVEAEVSAEDPFDCFAEGEDQRTWSRQKKAWCCTYQNVACHSLRSRSETSPDAAKRYALQGQQSERFSAAQDPSSTAPKSPSDDEGGSVWLFSLIMVLAVIVTYQRLKGGFCTDSSRRGYSYGPSGATTYGRSGNGVYSAVSTRYTPPAIPLG